MVILVWSLFSNISFVWLTILNKKFWFSSIHWLIFLTWSLKFESISRCLWGSKAKFSLVLWSFRNENSLTGKKNGIKNKNKALSLIAYITKIKLKGLCHRLLAYLSNLQNCNGLFLLTIAILNEMIHELREYKWNEYVTIAVNRNLNNCEIAWKTFFRAILQLLKLRFTAMVTYSFQLLY